MIFRDVIDGDLAVPATRRDDRDLPVERDEAFENGRGPADLRPGGCRILAPVDAGLPLAVIAEAPGLQDGWPSDPADGVFQFAFIRYRGEGRDGKAQA